MNGGGTHVSGIGHAVNGVYPCRHFCRFKEILHLALHEELPLGLGQIEPLVERQEVEAGLPHGVALHVGGVVDAVWRQAIDDGRGNSAEHSLQSKEQRSQKPLNKERLAPSGVPRPKPLWSKAWSPICFFF
jgi:hypothetical protein